MLELTSDWDYDAVGGLTLGADPVATAMLHAAAAQGRRLDAFVVRKEGKAHGLQRRIEGPDVAGRGGVAAGGTPSTRQAGGVAPGGPWGARADVGGGGGGGGGRGAGGPGEGGP